MPRPKPVSAPAAPLPNSPDKDTARRLCRLIATGLYSIEGGEITEDLVQMWALTTEELAQCRKIYAAFFEKFCVLELESARKLEFGWIDLLPVKGVGELMEKLENDIISVLGPSRGLGLSAMLCGALRDGGTKRMQIDYIRISGRETIYQGLCFSPDGTNVERNIDIRDTGLCQKPRWRHLDKFISEDK